MSERKSGSWVHLKFKDLWCAFASQVVVVRLSPRGFSIPSLSLASRLSEEYPGASFVDVSVEEFASAERSKLALGMLKEIGLDKVEAPPTGYYLFFEGRLRAWHPEIPPEAKSVAGGFAVAGGLLRALLGKHPLDAALSALDDYHRLCGASAFSFFKKVIEEEREGQTREREWQRQRREKEQRRRQREVFDSALLNAYAVLGVGLSASDAEIKSSHRELVRRYHPDRGGDEAKMKEVNNARDLIHAHRGGRAAAGASEHQGPRQRREDEARQEK